MAYIAWTAYFAVYSITHLFWLSNIYHKTTSHKHVSHKELVIKGTLVIKSFVLFMTTVFMTSVSFMRNLPL